MRDVLGKIRRWDARLDAHSRAIDALETLLEGEFKGKVGRESKRELGRILTRLILRRNQIEKTKESYLERTGNTATLRPDFYTRLRRCLAVRKIRSWIAARFRPNIDSK